MGDLITGTGGLRKIRVAGKNIGKSGGWSNGLTRQQAELKYTQAGTYEVTLTVTDNQDATATDSITVTVIDNFAPVANAGNDITIRLGDTAHLDGSASYDSNGEIVSYQWTGGSTESNPSMQFESVGAYTLTLTVTDDQGATATDLVVVTVTSDQFTFIDTSFTCKNT